MSTGVTETVCGTWNATISLRGSQFHVGAYKTEVEAIAARGGAQKVKEELHKVNYRYQSNQPPTAEWRGNQTESERIKEDCGIPR